MTKKEMREVIVNDMVKAVKFLIEDGVLLNDCGVGSIQYLNDYLNEKTSEYLRKFDRRTEWNSIKMEAIDIAVEELRYEGVEVYEITSQYEDEIQYYTSDYRYHEGFIKDRIFRSWYSVSGN